MFKLMIADDNPHFLKDLSEYIDWEVFDLELLGAFTNGKELLDAATINTPDLVITDVSMPIMNGFELSSQLYLLRPDITIVFISGYSEFRHAQQALKLGIFDYILKPLNHDNFVQCMKKAHQKLLNKQLLRLEQINNRSQQDYLRKIALSHYIGSLMFHADNESQIQENLAQLGYSCSTNTKHYVAYFSYNHCLYADFSEISSRIRADLLQLLFESSTADIQIIPTLIVEDTGVFLLSNSDPTININDIISTLYVDMEVNLNIRINVGYSDPCEHFSDLPALYSQALQVHDNLLTSSPIVPIASATDIPLDENHKITVDQEASCSYGPNVMKMREYIEQNYTSHISTNDVARHAFLSAGYANTCFTRECGTSIFNYIVQLRMKKASQLLKESDLPVTVIAELVGYSSKTSFYLAFKRYTGISPTTYRTHDEGNT